MDEHARIGAALRAARERADVSQAAMSEALGNNRRSVIRYENGERPFPAALLSLWADACGLKASTLARRLWP